MKIHTLKIEKNYWENLNKGRKKSEIRLNDRDYQVGDRLVFPYALDNGCPTETNSRHYFEITHIHSGLGLKEGFVVLSVEKKEVLE